jgi:hypothetical protein
VIAYCGEIEGAIELTLLTGHVAVFTGDTDRSAFGKFVGFPSFLPRS